MSFRLVGKLGLDTNEFERGLNRGDQAYGQFSNKLEHFAAKQEKFLFHHLIGAFGVGAIEHAIMGQLEGAQKLFNDSAKAGVPVERYQELQFAAEQTGESIENLVKLTGKLPANIQAAVDAFRQMHGVIPADEVANMARAAENIQQTKAGLNRIGSWFAQMTGAVAHLGTNMALSLHALYLRGKTGGEDAAMEEMAIIRAEDEGSIEDEATNAWKAGELGAKQQHRSEQKKKISEATAQIMQAAMDKYTSSLSQDEQIEARKKEISAMAAKVGKLKGDERDEAQLKLAQKRAELEMMKEYPGAGKPGETRSSGRLEAYDPLAHIGGFLQGGDASVTTPLERIARATESTAANTGDLNQLKGVGY